MGISVWSYVNGKNLDRLTQRHRALQYGLTSLVVGAAVVVFRWLADIFLGWDASFENTLGIAGGMLVGAAAVTIIRLIRGPQSNPGPDLILTDEMIRRNR